MFLSVKQQIENKTASLYNEFMGLDSIMLPQLIMDEAYAYEGMQEEVISSIIVNKLRSDLVIDRQDISYGYFALDKLLHTNFSEESFVKAMDGIKNPPKNKKDASDEKLDASFFIPATCLILLVQNPSSNH